MSAAGKSKLYGARATLALFILGNARAEVTARLVVYSPLFGNGDLRYTVAILVAEMLHQDTVGNTLENQPLFTERKCRTPDACPLLSPNCSTSSVARESSTFCHLHNSLGL